MSGHSNEKEKQRIKEKRLFAKQDYLQLPFGVGLGLIANEGKHVHQITGSVGKNRKKFGTGL